CYYSQYVTAYRESDQGAAATSIVAGTPHWPRKGRFMAGDANHLDQGLILGHKRLGGPPDAVRAISTLTENKAPPRPHRDEFVWRNLAIAISRSRLRTAMYIGMSIIIATATVACSPRGSNPTAPIAPPSGDITPDNVVETGKEIRPL